MRGFSTQGILLCTSVALTSIQYWTSVDGGTNIYFTGAGNVGIGTSTPTARLELVNTPTVIGSELITNGTFTSSALGWTLGTNVVYNAGSGNVTSTYSRGDPSVSTTFSTVAGSTYQITFTVSSSNAPLYYYFANQSNLYQPLTDGTYTFIFKSTYTGVDTLYFDDYNYTIGDTWTIDDISIREMSILPTLKVLGYDGSTVLSLGGDMLGNTAIGSRALQSNTTGGWNTANGANALYSNTTGYGNTANGSQALNRNTMGSSNTANGLYAGNNW